jgi:hypothetical protein
MRGVGMLTREKVRIAEDAYDEALIFEIDLVCCLQCVLVTVQHSVGIIECDHQGQSWPIRLWRAERPGCAVDPGSQTLGYSEPFDRMVRSGDQASRPMLKQQTAVISE